MNGEIDVTNQHETLEKILDSRHQAYRDHSLDELRKERIQIRTYLIMARAYLHKSSIAGRSELVQKLNDLIDQLGEHINSMS